MHPIVEKISDRQKEWMNRSNEVLEKLNPLREKLSDRHREIRDKGQAFWTDLHGRQEKLFHRGQEVLTDFEETVLNRMVELLDWAYSATGERSDVIRKGRDYFAERLTQAETIFGDDVEPEAADVEPVVEAAAEVVEPVEAPAEVVEAEPVEAKAEPVLEAPFEDYDELNVKKLSARFNDLTPDLLEQSRVYEEANKARKTVLEVLDRLLKD